MADPKNTPNRSSVPAKVSRLATSAAGAVSAADALGALKMMVAATRESIEIHEIERTKREKLLTYRETEVRRIKASERILRQYFDQIFQERRETHKRLFERLDRALESGDVSAMQIVVGGIVETARTSPLANIANLADLREAMDDPNTVFEF